MMTINPPCVGDDSHVNSLQLLEVGLREIQKGISSEQDIHEVTKAVIKVLTSIKTKDDDVFIKDFTAILGVLSLQMEDHSERIKQLLAKLIDEKIMIVEDVVEYFDRSLIPASIMPFSGLNQLNGRALTRQRRTLFQVNLMREAPVGYASVFRAVYELANLDVEEGIPSDVRKEKVLKGSRRIQEVMGFYSLAPPRVICFVLDFLALVLSECSRAKDAPALLGLLASFSKKMVMRVLEGQLKAMGSSEPVKSLGEGNCVKGGFITRCLTQLAHQPTSKERGGASSLIIFGENGESPQGYLRVCFLLLSRGWMPLEAIWGFLSPSQAALEVWVKRLEGAYNMAKKHEMIGVLAHESGEDMWEGMLSTMQDFSDAPLQKFQLTSIFLEERNWGLAQKALSTLCPVSVCFPFCPALHGAVRCGLFEYLKDLLISLTHKWTKGETKGEDELFLEMCDVLKFLGVWIAERADVLSELWRLLSLPSCGLSDAQIDLMISEFLFPAQGMLPSQASLLVEAWETGLKSIPTSRRFGLYQRWEEAYSSPPLEGVKEKVTKEMLRQANIVVRDSSKSIDTKSKNVKEGGRRKVGYGRL